VLSGLAQYMAGYRIAVDPAVLGVEVYALRHRIPYLYARLFGSRDPNRTVTYMQDQYTEGWWGGVMLSAGFLCQVLGAWLPSGHAWK
jgi:hypothetical protein